MNYDLPAGIQDIITTISEGDRTSVYLAADQNGDPLIYKVIRGDDRSGLYERIARSDSVFFPIIIECFYKDGETHVTEEFIEGRELDKVLEEAGFELRLPSCSACLAMNPDKVPAGKLAISTSNRNFVGRQGPGARTVLASPLVVAASAITGVITDPRKM
jgi:hypothetical protein